MKIQFWGVRGSYPVPGRETMRYGGNTSCVEVRTAAGDLIIIDAGTGIRGLGKVLMEENFQKGEGRGNLLISHTHWDHIQGFPFFEPLYQEGNQITIYSRRRDDQNLCSIFAAQTEGPYFSTPFETFQAQLRFVEIKEDQHFYLDSGVSVRTARLNHPFIALGYRLEVDGRIFVYISDTAPFRDLLIEEEYIHQRPNHEKPLDQETQQKLRVLQKKMVSLAEKADVVVFDTFWLPPEYERFPHWGHSTPDDAIEVCQTAGAKRLFLFHHLPSRTDAMMDQIVADYQRQVNGSGLDLDGAKEGLRVEF